MAKQKWKVGDKFKITFMGVTRYFLVIRVDEKGVITTKGYDPNNQNPV